MRRDVLGLMLTGLRTYGNVVRYKVGPLTVHLVCHPDDIAHVFSHHSHYDKNTFASKEIRRVTGDGLLVTSGELWARHRRSIQPAFNPARLATFVPRMVARTQGMLERWSDLARRGEPVDIASQMMRLTYGIVEDVLFSTDSGEAVGQIEQATLTALAHIYRRIEQPLSPPIWLPTPANRRFNHAMGTIRSRVDAIIAQHRRDLGHDDLLTDLIGQGFDDATLRSQTVTLLLAGHDTTALGLTWLWHLLGQHPQAADSIAREANDVLGQGGVDAAALDRLSYTSMVLRESLRLYTPIWAIVRHVAQQDQVGGYTLPRGSKLVISPYVTHRHPDFWPDAERFDPLRFEPAKIKAMHPFAYIPFGGGPRFCVGQSLARLESLLIAALVARRFVLEPVAGHEVRMDPGITLRCRGGLPMRLRPR
jgi:cytochrome P450